MAANRRESYAQIRDLLDAVGPHWLLSDLDPMTVWERELKRIPPPATFLPPVELLAILFKEMPEGL
jgi:hypothetical protein